MNYSYPYPMPSVTTDAVLFALDGEVGGLEVLLIERSREGEPFEGCWALPGGYLELEEELETCVRRELEEETGFNPPHLEEFGVFGAPGRDARGRVITVAYWGLVDARRATVRAGDDAARARWFDLEALPDLAFDHREIVDAARTASRGALALTPVGAWLLGAEFTLAELRKFHEILLGRPLEPRAFARRARSRFEPTGTLVRTGGRRGPAALYRFDRRAYARLRREGLPVDG
jgi:8-oxo-dGTP diphosphatase